MTLSPSRLADGVCSLVLDASSGLNLLGTGRAPEVLRAFPHEVIMTKVAAGEVGRDPLEGTPGDVVLGRLQTAGLLRIDVLSDTAYLHYLELVGAPSPDGLDDGEAATVAYAAEVGAVPVLDERKGTRIAIPLCASPPICTLDLLSHPRLRTELGDAGVADAVHSALLHARMRVPQEFRAWVVDLLGADRLRECSSVPKRWIRASP